MNATNSAPKDQPPTTGKVIIYTSHGQIGLQLWTKQAPLACKNFIQLCLEGYYNNTIFHRMIPGFMIQGGDPTGTGRGGQSIFGNPFKDQFHQRLKFTRRGILAMANAGKNTNNSQFFLTFAQCQHLNKKHTIFGKVIGDTVYNLLAMQSVDTDSDDRPIDPPIIRKIKVVTNPFDDLKLRKKVVEEEVIEPKQQTNKNQQQEKKQLKKQMKKLKQRNKLSFAEDQDLENDVSFKIKSSHDVLSEQKLSKKIAVTHEDIQKKKQQKEKQQQRKKQLQQKIAEAKQNAIDDVSNILCSQIEKKKKLIGKEHQLLQDQILNYKTRINAETNRQQLYWENQAPIQQQDQQQQIIQDQQLRQVRQMQKRQYEALKADQLNFKRIKQGSNRDRRNQMISEQKALLSNVEKRRYEYLKKSKQTAKQTQLFSKLNKFSEKLSKAGGNNWMNHNLKFHIDSQNAYKINQKRKGQEGRQFNYEDDGGLAVEDDGYMQQDQINFNEIYQASKK